jgi:5-formyltetrahydrofolate cyclo-ligase
MTKQELRKLYLQKRIALTPTHLEDLNQKLLENFFSSVDLSEIRVLHTFLPIEKKNEPNTWLIIDRIKKDFPKIRISIPRVNNQTGLLESFYFENKEQLNKNIWGILEPKQGMPTEPSDIDTILIPLLAFDLDGHRAGYGKGFYDKFLKTCSSSSKRIGISLFPPVDKIDNVNDFDEKLNFVITPEEVFKF